MLERIIKMVDEGRVPGSPGVPMVFPGVGADGQLTIGPVTWYRWETGSYLYCGPWTACRAQRARAYEVKYKSRHTGTEKVVYRGEVMRLRSRGEEEMILLWLLSAIMQRGTRKRVTRAWDRPWPLYRKRQDQRERQRWAEERQHRVVEPTGWTVGNTLDGEAQRREPVGIEIPVAMIAVTK